MPEGFEQLRAKRASSAGTDRTWRKSKDILKNVGELVGDYAEEKGPEKCSNLQPSCKCGLHTTDPAKAAAALTKDAKKYNPLFENLLHWLKSKGDEASKNKPATDFTWTPPKIKTAPIKGEDRMVEKIHQKYGCPGLNGARQLTDVVRGSLIFTKESSICFFLQQVLDKEGGIICNSEETCPKGLEKVSVRNAKNRFSRDNDGMRDFLVNVFMSTKEDPAGHVAGMHMCMYICMYALMHAHVR